jgi:chromosome segregation ATPase
VFGLLDLGAFSGLTGRLAQFGSDAGALAGQLNQVQQQASQQFNQIAQQLTQQIRQLREQIRDLQKRLVDLQKETPPDLNAIREVYQQIQRVSGDLTKRLNELSELNRARPNLSLQSSSSAPAEEL